MWVEPGDITDTDRMDWLESEMEREQAALKSGSAVPISLFRRNLPITREAIDRAMLSSPNNKSTQFAAPDASSPDGRS